MTAKPRAPRLPEWVGSFFYCLSLYPLFAMICVSAVDYNDGQTHSIQTPLNDAIALRSSSTLTLPPGDYAIRPPSGSDSAIRLYMSSRLNATGGNIFGADASEDYPVAGAGVIVGSASQADFHEGVTVRGGNHLGADHNEHLVSGNNIKGGSGGDAVVAQYFGSNITIRGGSFVAGHGSIKDGHSLHVSYEAQINVYGGDFYGSWMVRDKGKILMDGCVSRIGTRLVGQLENGHSLDIQLFEKGNGRVVLNNPEKCNHYRKNSKSFAVRAMRAEYRYSFYGMLLLSLVFAFE